MTLAKVVLSICVCTAVLSAPRAASAQTSPPTSGTEPKWEVEIYAGVRAAGSTGSGSGQLPAPGPTFVVNSLNSGRYVPSWFFGDGAALLNANNATNSMTGRVLPLDPVLTNGSATVGRGGAFGTRITRRLNPSWALEFDLQFAPRPLRFTDSAESDVVSARLSFETAMAQLLTFLGNNRKVVQSAETERSGTQTAVGTDLRLRLFPKSEWGPHLTVGGGVLLQSGASLTTIVEGEYSFVSFGGAPFHEIDSVTVRLDSSNAAFFRFGGGVSRNLGRRYGIRGDIGVMLAANQLRIEVDAAPTALAGTPIGVSNAFGLANTIRFSTNPSTQTSLSLPIDHFRTFTGSGWRNQVSASGGLFLRF